MKFISHRGYWILNEEKNSDISFNRSFSKGFGTETDIRDYKGNLVISHDMAGENNMSVDDFLEIYKSYKDFSMPLALNVKADGLQLRLGEILNKHEIKNYFVFDMSIPDTISYLKNSLNVYVRQSEYEINLPFYNEVTGIWLDMFESVWYDEILIKDHIENGKQVYLVSAELHKRDYLIFWDLIKKWDISKNDNLVLCTDFPEKAVEFFKS